VVLLRKLCITAGNRLSDIFWGANVLPYLRKVIPEVALVWECPISDIQPWLKRYTELDEVVGDVEMMSESPEQYVILHPFWSPAGAPVTTPLEAVFDRVKSWIVMPEVMPVKPYVPAINNERPELAGLPEHYICFEPFNEGKLPLDETAKKIWITLISYLAIPGVQMGSKDTPLLKGMIDGRGLDVEESSRLIHYSKLYIGGDSDLTCLAGAIDQPMIWLQTKDPGWWWPRVNTPYQIIYDFDLSCVDLEQLLGQVWEILYAGRVSS
jgi:hypothetical protein